jgi:SAM-dependent methyltransferase
MLERLAEFAVEEPAHRAGEDHPMRQVTRSVAADAAAWDPATRSRVQGIFDSLAPDWHSRHTEERLTPLRDALERGRPRAGRCVELGCGTGPASAVLAEHFEAMVSVDLSMEMLRRAAGGCAHRLRADASRLPFYDGSVSTLVLMNMLLFAEEMDRVLAPGGTLLWINSRGAGTPIHLSPEDLLHAMPGDWEGRTANAGQGLWCVIRRAGD